MTKGFVNHHVHSSFSTLDGMPSPKDIVERAVELGQKSVSITDHGSLSAIPDMYREAKKNGINFTPGCEMYFTENRKHKGKDRFGEKYYHLILLAYNEQGYRNLVKMQTPAWYEGYYHKARIDYEILEKYHEGLIVTTGCLGGLVSQRLLHNDYDEAKKSLSKLIDIFGGDNVYMEIQNHGISEQVKILPDQVKLAKEMNVGLLTTCDSHYCRPEDHDVHDSMICTAIKKQKGEKKKLNFENPEFYLHSEEEMLEIFPEDKYPGAVSNSVVIADRTNFSMKIDKDKEYLMPSIPSDDGMTESQTLRSHVIEGAKKSFRYGDENGNIPDEVMERIDYELGVVEKMGFGGYFLIVERLVNIFRENGIDVGPGRGCLHPDTDVLTQRGWTPISKVSEGDHVITAKGESAPVSAVLSYDTREDEKLIKITNEEAESIVLTQNHKVLTSDHNGKYEWKPARKIGVSDTLVHVTGNNEYVFEGFRGRGIPSIVSQEFDDSSSVMKNIHWGYVVGMMISRGVFSDGKISWTFSESESMISESLKSAIRESIADRDFLISEDKNGLVNAIVINDERIYEWIIKTISDSDAFVGFGPIEYSKGFVQALRSAYSEIPQINEVNTRSEFEANSLVVAATAIGIRSEVKGSTVFLKSADGKGFEKRTMVVSVDYVDRCDKVYDLTINGKYNPSFLTKFSTVHNSAPGSVVVYCLGITDIDPLAHDLFFERFLNPDRVSMPDIDIDVPKSRRKEALRLIEEEYGVGHVAHLANYNKLQRKDALNRMAKVFGLSPTEARKLTKVVSEYCDGNGETLKDFIEKGVIPSSFNGKLKIPDNFWKIIEHAQKIIGVVSNNGVHACGIVITDTPIDDHFPIRISNQSDIPVCQFDKDDTEALGGVKMDILGLINLDECEDTERNIRLDLGEDVDSSHLPLDDKDVYQLYSEGRGGGVFQMGCLSEDTIVDGKTIKEMFDKSNLFEGKYLRSVFLGKGTIEKNGCLKVVYSGRKKVFRILLENGKSLDATSEHKIFTKNGWKELKELKPSSDFVLFVNGEETEHHVSYFSHEKIVDMYIESHFGSVRRESVSPVTVGDSTFYPHVIDDGNFVLIYPEDGRHAARRAKRECDINGAKITIMSYSEVVEYYAAQFGIHELSIPESSEWVAIDSITPREEVDTYDIMMDNPVNNFIANGIMVHNSNGMQNLLRSMKPENFNDIKSSIALYRPGPMGENTHHEYCGRKNDGKPQFSLHEDMKEMLAKNYNLIIYQEDVMAISRKFAGYTGAEADDLRKAVAKKIPEKMEEQKRKFIPAVNSRYGDGLGEKIWNVIEPFGEYAFCNAHSSAYAAISYRTAWLKAHFPAQFSAAVIDHHIDTPDELLKTIAWTREEGVKILPPSILKSQKRTTTTKNSLTLPLHIIKGIGDSVSMEIIRNRETMGDFESIIDFVSRIKPSKKVLNSLAMAGAFDCLGVSRAAIINNSESIISIAKTRTNKEEIKEGLFFDQIEISDGGDEDLIDLVTEPKDIFIDGNLVRVDNDLYAKWERSNTGFFITGHPFETIRNLKSGKSLLEKWKPVDEFYQPQDDIKMCGMVFEIENKISNRGMQYCSFLFETDKASIPAVVYKKELPESLEGSMILAEGKIRSDSLGDDNDDFSPSIVCYDNLMRKVNIEEMKKRG